MTQQYIIDTLTPSTLRKLDGEYAQAHENHCKASSELTETLSTLANASSSPKDTIAIVTQALFNSGILSLDDRDFSAAKLWSFVYGSKLANKLGELKVLHKKLTDNGFTKHLSDHEYNSQGDNYFSAYSFAYTKKGVGSDNVYEGKNDVVIMETQSITYAAILHYSCYDDKVSEIQLVKLGKSRVSEARLNEFLELAKDYKLTNDYKWSVLNDSNNYGVIATLDMSKLEIEHILEPKVIESIMFQISHGHTCVECEYE